MIVDDLYSFLSANSGVSTIISTRIYPLLISQNTDLPAVSYSVGGEVVERDLSGTAAYTVTTVSIDCWASGYRAVKLLSSAVKTAMATATSYWWVAVLTSESDTYEPETGAYSVTLSYQITH